KRHQCQRQSKSGHSHFILRFIDPQKISGCYAALASRTSQPSVIIGPTGARSDFTASVATDVTRGKNMSQEKRDRELGMYGPISRRDFLNGAAFSIGSAALGEPLLASLGISDDAPEKALGYYPPALQGMRGNHDGSFASAHHLRDGQKWDASGVPESTGEIYDLLVVGGGISGLAAAYFFRRRAGKNARVLILDNHDDFGGHAKRNEF